MKKIILVIIIFVAISGIFVAVTFREDAPQPNTVIINDAAMVVATMPYDDIAELSDFLTQQLTYAFQEMDSQRESRDQRLQLVIYIFLAVFTTGVIWADYKYVQCDFRRVASITSNTGRGGKY